MGELQYIELADIQSALHSYTPPPRTVEDQRERLNST